MPGVVEGRRGRPHIMCWMNGVKAAPSCLSWSFGKQCRMGMFGEI